MHETVVNLNDIANIKDDAIIKQLMKECLAVQREQRLL